jgi:hypothetical protein
MCVYSMVTDHYTDKLRPYVLPVPYVPGAGDGTGGAGVMPFLPGIGGGGTPTFIARPELSAEEIVELRRDIAEFKLLLERAREYDRRNNEPDCELASKRQMVKAIASALGLDVSFV